MTLMARQLRLEPVSKFFAFPLRNLAHGHTRLSVSASFGNDGTSKGFTMTKSGGGSSR